MNFTAKKSFTLHLSAGIVVAGVALLSAPAQAANFGEGIFSFTGDAKLVGTGSTRVLDFATNTFPFYGSSDGEGDVGISSTGFFEPFRGGPVAIQDLDLVGGGPTGWSLSSPVAEFLSLTNEIKFQLDSFTLTREGSSWAASFQGFFYNVNNPAESMVGFGQWGTPNGLRGPVGAPFSSQITNTAVPTPALLPGLLALGASILRKRQSEETQDAEAIEVS